MKELEEIKNLTDYKTFEALSTLLIVNESKFNVIRKEIIEITKNTGRKVTFEEYKKILQSKSSSDVLIRRNYDFGLADIEE